MNAAKMKPCGMTGEDESDRSKTPSAAFDNAGVHSSTKTYMEPSNID